MAPRSVVGGSRVKGEKIPSGEDGRELARELWGERAATGSREVDATGVSEGGGAKEVVLLVNCPVAECLDGRLRDRLGICEP